MKRKPLWIGTLAILHACLTIAAVVASMRVGMMIFDGTRERSTLDNLMALAPRVLTAPVVPLYQHVVPRTWQRVPLLGEGVMLLNSLVWGMAVVWLLERRSRQRIA